MSFISSQPYFSITQKCENTVTDEKTGIIEQEFSMNFFNERGYTKEDKEEILTKLLTCELQSEYYT